MIYSGCLFFDATRRRRRDIDIDTTFRRHGPMRRMLGWFLAPPPPIRLSRIDDGYSSAILSRRCTSMQMLCCRLGRRRPLRQRCCCRRALARRGRPMAAIADAASIGAGGAPRRRRHVAVQRAFVILLDAARNFLFLRVLNFALADTAPGTRLISRADKRRDMPIEHGASARSQPKTRHISLSFICRQSGQL